MVLTSAVVRFTPAPVAMKDFRIRFDLFCTVKKKERKKEREENPH